MKFVVYREIFKTTAISVYRHYPTFSSTDSGSQKKRKNKQKTLQDIFGWNLEFTITDLDPVLFRYC